MAINYNSKEDMEYLFKALRECCGLDSKTPFKVKDIQKTLGDMQKFMDTPQAYR